ncbi:hypothetical protein [Flavobacterium sedimenticola]|uniref:Uncharacterized protein n=1 Tax=Flavobacterium sedimenticola TaxID=3043286 RepID=A0ABT6XS23_9FLAO|nr:hypothetical protein [Flavobacterium sedimenticola]MDI9257893.1 hypothetical protein [Flavobacterium sedimenticola]
MKKNIVTFVLLVATMKIWAIDRIVQENGPTGTFSSISAAITASVDGDRIIIHPKIGGNPYIEDLTINKALEFLSAEDGNRYKIQGNVTIAAAVNRKVTIIGAHLVAGNIIANGTGWPTTLNVMGCLLNGGDINASNQFKAAIVSNILENGSILLSHGNVIGNELKTETKSIFISNSTSVSNDTMSIIGNKTPRITCTSDIFLNIINNFIARVNSTTTNFFSIHYTFSSSLYKLKIINNTIITPRSNSTSTVFSDNTYLWLESFATIKNNIFQFSTPNGSVNRANTFNVVGFSSSYNYYFTSNIRIANTSTEVNLTDAPVTPTTGQLITSTLAQNGADPSFEFYDLDLTVGDAGCYGGSYSLNNYFPITGSSRVYNIDMPFGITTTGAPLEIKADGFDR